MTATYANFLIRHNYYTEMGFNRAITLINETAIHKDKFKTLIT